MFFAVVKAVGITVGLIWIGSVSKFFAVVDAVAITVGFGWVGSGKYLFRVGKSVIVRVVGRVGYDPFC